MLDKQTIRRHITEARENQRTDAHPNVRSVHISMVLTLAEMAAHNIEPDGTFSDAEVSTYEAMLYAIALSKQV